MQKRWNCSQKARSHNRDCFACYSPAWTRRMNQLETFFHLERSNMSETNHKWKIYKEFFNGFRECAKYGTRYESRSFTPVIPFTTAVNSILIVVFQREVANASNVCKGSCTNKNFELNMLYWAYRVEGKLNDKRRFLRFTEAPLFSQNGQRKLEDFKHMMKRLWKTSMRSFLRCSLKTLVFNFVLNVVDWNFGFQGTIEY